MPSFTHSLNIIGRCTQMQRGAVLKELGVCGGQVPYLLRLCRCPGLTQEELAVRLNVSDRHLRSLESGEYIPSIDLFIEIAAFFDVTLDHLIMGKSLSDQEESLRNKLQQKRLTNQKLRLKLQRIMQKLSAIAEEL